MSAPEKFALKILHGHYIPFSLDGRDKTGETLVVEGVTARTTIGELKERIMALNTKDPTGFWFNADSTLMYAGETLDRPRCTLKEYNIGPGLELNMPEQFLRHV